MAEKKQWEQICTLSKFGDEEFEGIAGSIESCKIVFLGAVPIDLFRHFCCRMYRSATVHSVSDKHRDDMMPTADHTACSGTLVPQLYYRPISLWPVSDKFFH